MQSREEELSKLYEVLDREDLDREVEDKYIESVRRRLSREYISVHTKGISQPLTKALTKPKVKIFGGVEKKVEKEREEEEKVKEEKVSREERKEEKEIEDLFEIEKIGKEELKRIVEKEKVSLTVEKGKREVEIAKPEEERIISKDKFVEVVSKIKGIGKRRAELLYESGYNSFDKIIKSEPKEIAEKVRGLSEEVAERLKREVSEIIPKMEEEFDQVYLLKESRKEKREVEREISKTGTEFKEELPEWVTIDKIPTDEEPIEWKKIEKEEPYRYEDYTLYKVEKRGKVKYVFSKRPVRGGEPCQIPKGYVVRVNRKGKPSLEKVK